MSIDANIIAARQSIDELVAAIRQSEQREEPALLIRAGRIAIRVQAAEALARHGDGVGAALLATKALREIARDFPERRLPPLDLLAEDRAYRALATSELNR